MVEEFTFQDLEFEEFESGQIKHFRQIGQSGQIRVVTVCGERNLRATDQKSLRQFS